MYKIQTNLTRTHVMKQKRNLKDETDLKNLKTKQSCHIVRCPCYNNGATLRSCLPGSGEILSGQTDPPFVQTGLTESRTLSNGKLCKFFTWSELGQNFWPVYGSTLAQTRVNTWAVCVFAQFSLRGKSLNPTNYVPSISQTRVNSAVVESTVKREH